MILIDSTVFINRAIVLADKRVGDYCNNASKANLSSIQHVKIKHFNRNQEIKTFISFRTRYSSIKRILTHSVKYLH